MNPLIQENRQAVLDLAVRHGVNDLRVFGSMSRCDAGEDSDLNLLVGPLPGTGLLDLGGLLMEAQELVGRRVDVLAKRRLTGALRTRILREAVPL